MFEQILLPKTKSLLSQLKPDNLPKDSYLGGGTAIALQIGHRRSADLDFFTPSEFVEIQWEEKLKKELGFKLLKRDWQTLIGTVREVKISIFGYRYKAIRPSEKIYRVSVASLPDLAAMKLETILDRGTKRDLIDIYFLAQKFTLRKMFEYYQEKYCLLAERELMIKKALTYFVDAEADEMPDMLVETDWEKIKNWLLNEIKNLESF